MKTSEIIESNFLEFLIYDLLKDFDGVMDLSSGRRYTMLYFKIGGLLRGVRDFLGDDQ